MLPQKRFLKKVRKTRTCWIWTAYKNKQGYGQFRSWLSRGMILAHRASFILFVGPIPNGMKVLHSCDNPSCVNPKHLRAGTLSDNTQEMYDKGRGRTHSVRGSNHGIAKLNEEKVLAIRATKGTHDQIAKQFNISRATITNIKNRKVWTHI